MVHGARFSPFWMLILATPLLAEGVVRPSPTNVPRINSRRFDVLYELDAGTGSLERVELWYTTDEGRSWQRGGIDDDRVSPMSFRAPTEGLLGLYVIASNAGGTSGQVPGPSTTPQCWVFVDSTPPVVQLHAIQQNDPPTVPQVLHIRWSAIDDGLVQRPISLSYRAASTGPWKTIAGPIANAGARDWRVPESVTGDVEIRLTVVDLGGNVAEASSPAIHIERSTPSVEKGVGERGGGVQAQARLVHSGDGDATRLERALQLYQQGRRHAARGEQRLAASRFRDALAVDPELTKALVGLGGALYAQGEGVKSAEAYELALAQQPGLRDARQGLALAYIGQRRFGDAVQQLSRIVQANANDAEAWLNLGDVFVYQGDEMLAREHYKKAMTLDPSATDTIEKARIRLANIKQLAADFRQTQASEGK